MHLLWAFVPSWYCRFSPQHCNKSFQGELIRLMSNPSSIRLCAYVLGAAFPQPMSLSSFSSLGLPEGTPSAWRACGFRPGTSFMALAFPSNLMSKTSLLLFLQVEILPQGRESTIFKQFFKDWK